MKTKEELNALKAEAEALSKKLAELSEEELEQVTGGLGFDHDIRLKPVPEPPVPEPPVYEPSVYGPSVPEPPVYEPPVPERPVHELSVPESTVIVKLP